MNINNNNQYNEVINIIKNSKSLTIFSGAGISKASNIETFRGSSNSYWVGFLGKLKLAIFGTPIGWKYMPEIGYTKYKEQFYKPIINAEPNDAHIACYNLENYFEKNNKKTTILTMNVDGLHQRSGSKNVNELHGTITKHKCSKNHHPMNLSKEDILNSSKEIPKCQICQSTPRPDCVLFTENLPTKPLNDSFNIVNNLNDKDVMLVIGTSSQVYPAQSLPEIASTNKCKIIEFNVEPTNFTKQYVDIFIQGKVEETLPKIINQIIN